MRFVWLARPGPLLAVMFAAGVAAGCDDSSPTTPDAGAVDAGPTDAGAVDAATNPCWGDSLSLPCCYQRSNADRRGAAQLKLVDFDNALPMAFTDPATAYGFTQALRLDALMLAFELQGADEDGPIDVRLGPMLRDDAGYRWPAGDAPGPGDAQRWDPVTTTATIEADRVTSDPAAGEIVAPIYDTDGTTPVEVHLSQVRLVGVALTDERTCVGQYDDETDRVLGMGRITAFLRVEPSLEGSFPVVGVTPCEVYSGGSCEGAQETWRFPPDSMCDAGGCREGDCTPDTCNAWRFDAQLGAAGVEIR